MNLQNKSHEKIGYNQDRHNLSQWWEIISTLTGADLVISLTRSNIISIAQLLKWKKCILIKNLKVEGIQLKEDEDVNCSLSGNFEIKVQITRAEF